MKWHSLTQHGGGAAPESSALRWAAWLIVAAVAADAARVDAALRTVALSGQVAPGTAVTFDEFITPAIGAGGHVAFRASLAGAGVDPSNQFGVWSYNGGAGGLLARGGGAAGSGATFIDFDAPTLNASGQAAFMGYLAGGGAGVWTHDGGSLTSVVRRGDAALGTAGKFEVFLRLFGFNDAGDVAVRGSATVLGPGAIESIEGIWSTAHGGSLQPVARKGGPAPGTGSFYAGPFAVGSPVLNAQGHAAFYGFLGGGGATHMNDEGIWRQTSGGVELVVREGELAPGLGPDVRFGGRNFDAAPAINAAGDVAFLSTLTGPGVAPNRQAIWSRASGGPLRLVARSGGAAPGTSHTFLQFDEDPIINSQGHVAFSAFLTGVVDGNGLWSEGPGGGLELVVREGDAAPATDALFTGIHKNSIALNARGQIAFVGALAGGAVNGTNDLGLWAQDLTGDLRKIVREGDFLDVDDGPAIDLRRVQSFLFEGGSGNGDGRRSGFNDAGQVTFAARFTDGTQGVFVSTAVVPEPAAAILAALAAAARVATTRGRKRSPIPLSNFGRASVMH